MPDYKLSKAALLRKIIRKVEREQVLYGFSDFEAQQRIERLLKRAEGK